MLAGGGQVAAKGQECAGAGLAAPAAGDLLLDLDHPDVAFGLVVVERDAEVGGEAQHVVAVAGQPGQQRAGWAQGGPAAFAGAGRRRVQSLAFGDQGVVAVGERGQLLGRQSAVPAAFRGLHGEVHLDDFQLRDPRRQLIDQTVTLGKQHQQLLDRRVSRH